MAHIIVFSGEYDLANKHGLRRTLQRLQTSEDLILDLTEVTFADSTFITELILFEKAREAKNLARATIVAPAKSVVRRLFEVAGLMPVLTIVDSYNGRRDDPNSIIELAPNGDDLDAMAETLPAEHVKT